MVHKLVLEFREKFKPNMMTPEVISEEVKGNSVIELSKGTGIYDEPIFGVTVETMTSSGWVDTGKSKMFHSFASAKSYARQLKREL